MTIVRLIELVAAVAMLSAAIWLYRRKPAKDDAAANDGHYGSQGAVLLLVVAVIIAIHAVGGLDYRPSSSELEMLQGLKSVGRGG